ncbi:heparinase II/III family protein [Janthinobacterium sp. LB3P118]|uniref:heparinase II/III family protein n=1 Tax=Janthinobacterium sp. LB3P118 TaxID=3424195 RepID=UPI003F288216
MNGVALRYWHTLRHLKPIQFYGRIWFKYRPVSADLRPAPPLRPLSGIWVVPAPRAASLSGEAVFCFLNETHDLDTLQGWDDTAVSKLWRYNLHYFDMLHSGDATRHGAQHHRLLLRWMRENPPGQGSGWEPYPTSLRVINWIKWALNGTPLSPEELDSLAIQVRWLSKRLEIHLLGNHLFANAKALIFAGLFFSGPEAAKWLATGMQILAREIPEQILPDGGQFERSTMYHALALEDILDLDNVTQAFGAALDARARALTDSWRALAGPMHAWLLAMSHPDRLISFFNDAAFDIAVPTPELEKYASRLGHACVLTLPDGVHHLADSGFLRIQQDQAVALLDIGPIGPDYLPGHAHADTLSFELSLFGQRVFVNSGTSEYGLGTERLRQRGTSAHNTVCVDQQDSSEVWSGFRVARRARTTALQINPSQDAISVSCAHDGYHRLPGKNLHSRTWRIAPGSLELCDTVSGAFGKAEAHFHLHPDVCIMDGGSQRQCLLKLPEGQLVDFGVTGGGTLNIVESTWHPRFGQSQPTSCLVVRLTGATLTSAIHWHPAREK